MIQITPHYRVLGGMVAGLIGVAVLAGAKASADPLVPAPPPAPVGPGITAPAPQNVINPGAVNGNRFTADPAVGEPVCAAEHRHRAWGPRNRCRGTDAAVGDSGGLRHDP